MDQNQPSVDQEIDLLELARKLWLSRKTFYKFCGIAVLVALVVAFSIPKEYTVTVTLSPESGESSTGGNLGGIASMMGVTLGGSETDALNITLFPDILSSNPFALELYGMPVPVEDGEETTSMPLNEYMESQSQPWWGWLMSLPGKAVGGLLSLFKDEEEGSAELNPFRLSVKETGKLEAIKKSMSANVDKKTGVTTLTVTLQDPLVAATVADSVVCKLQDYVTDYRTRKAIDDCAYWEKLYRERQSEYYAGRAPAERHEPGLPGVQPDGPATPVDARQDPGGEARVCRCQSRHGAGQGVQPEEADDPRRLRFPGFLRHGGLDSLRRGCLEEDAGSEKGGMKVKKFFIRPGIDTQLASELTVD